jgi:predicted chitinase
MAGKNPQRRSAATEETESSSADRDLVNLETAAPVPLGAGDVASAAEPAPPPPSQLLTYKVIARDGLNLRAGPGTEFPIRRNLPFGTLVSLLKRDGPWALVDTIGDGGADGFAFAAFLEEQPAAPQIVALPAAPGATDFIELDASLLQIIMDRCAGTRIRSQLDLNVVVKALDDAMIAAHADTRLREVAFLSQAVIETDYFRTFEEYGKGRGKPYFPYYGRGMHQLTWKPTYAACSNAVFGDDRLVRDPNLVINDINVNIQATAWYWRDYKPFNQLADAQDIDEIIHRLYGGTIKSRKPEVRKSVELRRSFYTTIKDLLVQRSRHLI